MVEQSGGGDVAFPCELEVEPRACSLCGCEVFRPLLNVDRYGLPISTSICDSCGFVATNPCPTEESLADFYENHYRRFYTQHGTPSLEYVTKYGRDGRAAYHADRIAANFGEPPNTVLDFGSAEGSLLKALIARFPAASFHGVEVNPDFSAFAESYAAPARIFRSLDAIEGVQFDLITMIHVLEHVPDPVALLAQLAERLRSPESLLYIDVPDVERYSTIADIHVAHLLHFSARTLAAACRQAGLSVISLERHDPPMHPASIRCLVRRGNDGAADAVDPLPSTSADAALSIEAMRRVARSARIQALKDRPQFRMLRKLRAMLR